MTSRDRPSAAGASVVMLVADGARADILGDAMSRGDLPALARLREEGALHRVTTVFPSVTGPAYAPFLLGRFPGRVGLPGLRWFDRARGDGWLRNGSRSYVGSEVRKADSDLDPSARTIFELAPSSLSAMSMIGRGVAPRNRLGHSVRFGLRAAWTHFRGDLRGWLGIDRDIANRMVRRIAAEQPAFAFCALLCTDKLSHAAGHESQLVRDALRIVDDTAARIRRDAERAGRWDAMHLWILSDHGHSPVTSHDDLADLLRSWRIGVRAHPFSLVGGRDVSVMVSGNAMAHLYLHHSDDTTRRWWPSLDARWGSVADRLLERPSVDLMLLPLDATTCEVRSSDRGSARISVHEDRYSYEPRSGDPLRIGAQHALSRDAAHDICAASDYPDALVQIAELALSPRAGDIIVSAARSWDFRARWEPIPHVSAHGALHREHMEVPLLLNRPAAHAPRRTTDVMPSALSALGLTLPGRLDGRSFV